jgi:hypothetical protein
VLLFQWNALRVGDTVDVHDPDDQAMGLVPGVVTMVQTSRGANDLGIRLGSGRTDADGVGLPVRVLRPARLTVHLDRIDADRGCWRCDEIAAITHPSLAAVGTTSA